MRTIAIIQARLGSSRLPSKVLADITGKPLIEHVIERAALIPGIHGLCLAIPASDARLSRYADGHYVVTGPEEDVLSRYMLAAEITNAKRIVRVTADCPLLDPYVAGAVLALHDTEGGPYASNVHPKRTWPDGLDVEVFTLDELVLADRIAQGAEREHVTTVMRWAKDRPCLESAVDLGRLKWSVDTSMELDFVRKVMDAIPTGAYRMADTLDAIRRMDMWTRQPESDDWRKLQ